MDLEETPQAKLVSSLLKRMPKLPVKHGAVDTTGSEFSHYMATIIQLATELNDVPRGGDSEGGFYLAQVLRYIQNNPNVPLKDVPHLSRTRGAEGRNPDGILYQVLHQGLSAIWDIIPKGILESCSAIELFRFFVSLKPLNPTAVLKELRDRVLDAGTPGAEIQPVRDLKYLVDTMRILSRAITHYESRSGTSASEPTYAARLTDVMIRLYAPIASKPGSKGGTLSQALSSRSTLKQMQENTDQLTWREMMDTCIRFGEENSTPQLVTSMLANPTNPAKDTDSGAPADKGSRRGGSRGSDRKADTGGKGGKGTAYSTTNGTSTGLCLHHCIRGSCDFRSNFCKDHVDDAHPPARAGHGILASECASWPVCSKNPCPFGLKCVLKHGDGSEQIATKHGKKPAQGAAQSYAASGSFSGNSPDFQRQFADFMTEFRTSNSLIGPLLQQHANANAQQQPGTSGLLPSLTPWAKWLRQRGQLMTSLL